MPKRLEVTLVGKSGNAFAILGACQKVAQREWTPEEWEKFRIKATSGNYDHLLQTVMEYFDVN